MWIDLYHFAVLHQSNFEYRRLVPNGRFVRLALLVLLAPAGVLVGHALTYLMVLPDPARRAAVLAASGHAWWAVGAPMSTALAGGGITLLIACLLNRDRGGGQSRHEFSYWLGRRLASAQLLLFAALETVERVVAGHSLSDPHYHEIVEHGVIGQLIVALIVTGLCWSFALTLDLVCAHKAEPDALPVLVSVVAFASRPEPRKHRLGHTFGARAPPLPC